MKKILRFFAVCLLAGLAAALVVTLIPLLKPLAALIGMVFGSVAIMAADTWLHDD